MSDDGEAVKLLNNLFKHLETGNPIPAGAHFHGLLRDFLLRRGDPDLQILQRIVSAADTNDDAVAGSHAIARIAARLRGEHLK